ncbi:MAG: hypothetical protein HKP61_11605 [Dactylosporangium sp.]|nr:hypothetical protein [Dactylosporangium sp.]NNJ61570.1 hypothetical protein [Dactylosporangium sp.]
MYAWIWRNLPFGLRGKIAGSMLIVISIGALLWFVVFPIIEPIMPFNNGQLDDGGSAPTQQQPASGPDSSQQGPDGQPSGSGVSMSPLTVRPSR